MTKIQFYIVFIQKLLKNISIRFFAPKFLHLFFKASHFLLILQPQNKKTD